MVSGRATTMTVFEVKFDVEEIGELECCEFIISIDDSDSRTAFDVIVEAKSDLEPYKNEVGLFFTNFGYKIPTVLDAPELIKLSRLSKFPILVTTEFNLNADIFAELKFSDLLKSENAIEFLRNQKKLHLKDDDELLLGTTPITYQMSIFEFLERNAKEKFSTRKTKERQVTSLFIQSANSSITEAFNHYTEAASRILAQTDLAQDTISKEGELYPLSVICDNIYAAAQDNSFLFFSGPSWSGKTQLVYVLDKLSLHPMKLKNSPARPPADPKFFCVFHLYPHSNSYEAQPINQVEKDISKALLHAAFSDWHCIRDRIQNWAESGDPDLRLQKLCVKFQIEYELFVKAHQKEVSSEKLWEQIEKTFPKKSLLTKEFIQYFAEICPLKSLGILSEIIELRAKDVPLDKFIDKEGIIPLKYGEFKEKTMASITLPVLACIDEFNLTYSFSREDHVVFLRNLICVIPNIVPVLSGTNAKASNLANELCDVDDFGPHPWCRLVYKLPPCTFGSIGIGKVFNVDSVDKSILNWLRVACQRPGLLELFIKIISPLPEKTEMKLMLEYMHRSMSWQKSIIHQLLTVEAIYEMIFSRCRLNKISEHASSVELIHFHFPHLIPNNQTSIDDLPMFQHLYKAPKSDNLHFNDPDEQIQQSEENIFSPYSLFLDLPTDELVRMVLMADGDKIEMSEDYYEEHSKLVKFFKQAEENESKVEAKKEVIRLINEAKNFRRDDFSFRLMLEILQSNGKVDFESGVGVRSGNKLARLINGAFVMAAALGGPSGSSLQAFLPNFVSEILLKKPFKVQWDQKSLGILGRIKDQLVPYIIAVDYQTTTEFRSIEGVFTGKVSEFSENSIGHCVPDWINTIQEFSTTELNGRVSRKVRFMDRLVRHKDTLPQIAKNFLALSANPQCQMIITVDVMNRLESAEMKDTLECAVEHGKKISKQWPKDHQHPIHHLHFICVASMFKLKDWNVQVKSPMCVFKLTLEYDKIGLKTLIANYGRATTTVIIIALDQICPYEL